MSRTTNRDTRPGDRGPVDHRLARLLDTASLARVVPHLAPETLHQLIEYRGLAACGELVTCATPAQLTSLLDLDLWRGAQPGHDERFDADRFGEWLEVLVDAGDSLAARTVAALDEHLVVGGLSRYLRVFDPGTFEPTESIDDEPVDRHEKMNGETSADLPECEVGGYLVRARRADAWDAIVTLLVTLETEHDRSFHAIMQGCRRLSNSRPEIDGLDDLLPLPAQHLHDVAVARERRRSRHGYVTSADARAFLQMARHGTGTPLTPTAMNPIATAYFRTAEHAAETAPARTATRAADVTPPPAAAGTSPSGDDDIPASVDAVLELLGEVGMAPRRPPALPAAAEEDPRAARLPLLRRLMAFVLHHDEPAYLVRTRELAFLANALLAGSSVLSRPFTLQEASDAAASTCNLGLECWPAPWPGESPEGASSPREPDRATLPDAFLTDHDLVAAFEAGWSVLYHDVCLFVADQLASTVADLHGIDAETRRGLRALERDLARHREAGTPWLARDSADVLGMLDMTGWVALRGLLDECPVVPAALTAILERRSTSVDPTAFDFISTTAQIGDIRLFMRALADVLAC